MPSNGTRNLTPAKASIANGEVVLRGTTITLTAPTQLAEAEHRSLSVLGHRATVAMSDDRRSLVVDTGGLPAGRHILHADSLTLRTGRTLSGQDLEFVVVDSKAKISDRVALHHATRVRIEDLDVQSLPMDGIPDGEYIDVFKAEDRRRGTPMQLAFDQRGREVDLDERLAELAKRRLDAFGRIDPALHATMQRQAVVPVAIWLAVDEDERAEKSPKRATLKRPRAEGPATERRRAIVERLRPELESMGVEIARVDEHAPVIYADLKSDTVRALAENDLVAAVFLRSDEGILDLTGSIAIANSDDAHTAGFDGTGVNVAVYEDAPDSTTNLQIAARYTTSPATSQHARHTHGIIKNIQSGAPHGHAPDCNLHSANSMDLAAIRWAAQDRGCTVISQSFHRGPEQTSSGLSFDDVYKDWLALHWPYPTICEAAGNGADSEYVNHKGYNRLTVANHNDTATAMASDTCFRNPSSSHGDRELPEIAANGTGVTTVGLTMSGTSMAAPAVAGAVACVQEANSILKSWPEGCRAIMMAAAWRNPDGGTWRSDLVTGVDGVDGAGALDTKAAVDIARSRSSRNGAAKRRGWDVGTSRKSDFGSDKSSTYTYRISVPRTTFRPHVKVALAWDAHVKSFDIFGLHLPLSSSLTVDLDLHVRDSHGNLVAASSSWDNSYEIAEFSATPGETYDIKLRRWSGTDDVWYGIAWTVTGLDILIDRFVNAGTTILHRS